MSLTGKARQNTHIAGEVSPSRIVAPVEARLRAPESGKQRFAERLVLHDLAQCRNISLDVLPPPCGIGYHRLVRADNPITPGKAHGKRNAVQGRFVELRRGSEHIIWMR